MEGPKIVVRGLSKVFGTGDKAVLALDDVSFTVPKGQFLCILGPSGCGKTTLLRILAGLEKKTGGHLVLHHENPAQPLNSMVFQEYSLLPWLTVLDNVAYGLRMRGIPPREREARARGFIDKVGLGEFARSYPHQLSGGMKQRVSVARAFVNDPEILLMDEPFASLDEQNKILLQQELLRIWEGTNKTVVYVTHSIDEALYLGDRILLMTARPGRIKRDIEVSFPRPRDFKELKTNPRFAALFAEVWGALKEEVLGTTLKERPPRLAGT